MARPRLAFQDDTALQGPNANALIAAMKAAGTRDARINVTYGKVKAEGYGAIDQEVNALRAAGIAPQLTIMGTPSYSPHLDQSLSYQNTNPRVARDFAAEVAAHFKGRVGRYSPWNEPNWGGFISGADKSPKQAARRYRELYRAMEAGIHGVDKGAQVMLGEMTAQPNAKEFLRYLLAGKGLKTAGFAYHPYDSPNVKMRNGRNPSGTWDIDTLGDLQHTLASYARQGKLRTRAGKAAPLYLTEMGYLKSDVPSEQGRAARMARAYDLATKAGARQFLSYQMSPTAPKVTPDGAPVVDAYGGVTPGAPGGAVPQQGWVWDTSLGPTTLAQAIRRRRAPVARAARARR